MSASTSSGVNRDKNKRRNAPLSCAECRRLKLRCSRVFPCASCVKKGCAAICPDGSLTTGKGNRFVLANTEVLHEKISVLANRVRQLEDALHESHSAQSDAPHPLLTEELLQLKRPLERESSEAPKEPDPETSEAINALGSLSINEYGHSNFFGTTANAWYLLQNEEGADDETESSQVPLPTDIPWLSHTFPFSTSIGAAVSDVRVSIASFLPDATNAQRLAQIYYRHAGWMYTPVPEAEFYGVILPRIYEPPLVPETDPIDSHRLAVVFLIFALGTLLDLDKPYLSIEALQYYQLGRAALSLDSILDNQSVPAIQALVLMCHFMFLSFIEGPRWALMGLAVKLAQSVGLHRDSGKWNLDPEETFKRRSLMWELYTYDSWQSLTYGRPPSFSMTHIDCQMAEETTKTDQGDIEMSFAAWKHRFSSRCLSIVHEQAFGARTPSYKTIQELDKKVRNHYVPPSLRVPGFGGARMDINMAPTSIEVTMQRYIAFAIQEITIFYLHRGFFAKAVEDHPEDPLGSKYAPSFLAAYNSACSFVGLIKSLYSQHPGLTERMWFLFTHVFSCAIVLGSIPTKCPSMALARSALSHLESACSLFEEVSGNARAAKVVPVLRKLKGRAMVSMSDMQSNGASPINRLSPDNVKEEDDALATLGGKTRLVSRKSPSVPSSPQGTSGPMTSPIELTSQQSYPIDSPLAPETSTPLPQNGLQNGLHGVVQSQWQPYSPQTNEVYDYPYPASTNQWQPDTAYGHIDASGMTMDMPMHYNAYNHTQPMANAFVPSHSPLDPSGNGRFPGTDPDASWRSLFAQFNQA